MELGLQWLRPWWLLALIPAAWLLWLAWQINIKQGAWHKIIDPKFQPLLLGEQSNQQFTLLHKLSLIGLAAVWLIITIIMAGPSFKSVEIPAQKSQSGTIIVLDLSLSMLADDLRPNRLNRVKLKLTDLIKNNPEEAIGLVVYAGTAHTITPISEDNQTLLSLLPALNPVIMPKYGSNPIAGFEQAKAMFEGGHVTDGHLLCITDDIEASQVPEVESWLKQHDYSLSILTVGTTQGGLVEIPNYGPLKDDQGNIVLPAVPAERFLRLSQDLDASLNALKIEANDSSQLLASKVGATTNEEQKLKNEKAVLHPLDQGASLLLILVPLLALVYRRGWLFSFMLAFALPLGLVSYTPPSFANNESSTLEELGNMFQTHDQQAYHAWKKDNFAAAQALFEDPQWQASSLYRLGRYDEAAKLFAQDKSAFGFYNLGNALAKSNQLEAAKTAYQQALKRQPEMTKAQQNLAIVEQLLADQNQTPPEQENNSDSQGDGQPKNQSADEQSDKKDPKQQNDAQGAQSQDPADKGENPEHPKPTNQTDATKQSAQNDKANDQQTNADSAQSPQAENTSNSPNSVAGQANNPAPQPEESKTAQNEARNTQDLTDSNLESDSDSAPENTDNSANALDNEAVEAKSNQQAEKDQQTLQQLIEDQADSAKNTDTQGGNSPNQLMPDKTQGDSSLLGAGESEQPSTPEQEKQLATDNWIQQIPDNASLFLQRKFDYQYQQMQQENPQTPSADSAAPSAKGQKSW